MSFSENLQTLRKANNISQEQLAERLDVSRQAVSKWETDGGYPEMDKIIALCGIFNCTMDELVTGKVSVDKPGDRKVYDDHYNRFARGIALGVALIIFGAALTEFISTFGSAIGSMLLTEGIAPVIFVMCVAAAVAMFIILGIGHTSFRKLHHSMPEIYTLEEKERFNKRFAKAIAAGVTLIIVALLPIIVIEAFIKGGILSELVAVPIFLTVLSVSVGTIVYSGIQHSKYDIERYNLENIKEYGVKDGDNPALVNDEVHKKRSLSEKICGVIMLTATLIFVAIGLWTNEWHPTWVVFPVGGILCAIVNVIFDN